MWRVFKANMPTTAQIANEAISTVITPERDNAAYIKANYDALVRDLERTAYDIYLAAQERAFTAAVADHFSPLFPDTAAEADAIRIFGSQFEELDSFWLSLTNSRKSRAGTTFETILRTLFKKLNYPFDEQEVINGKPDFLLPGREHFNRNAMDCIIFTAKRTLRERWRQIVTEGTRGLGFFLATIDEKVTTNQIAEIRGHRIYLVYPQAIIDEIHRYQGEPNIINFSTFFQNYLDPAMRRWLQQGTIDSLGDAQIT